MGQGTESCGGYELDYDEYEEGLESGMWVQRNGTAIHVSKMTQQHLRAATRMVLARAECATWTSDAEKWQAWADLFEHYITRAPTRDAVCKPAEPTRGTKQRMQCHCGVEYDARVADLKRGWALSCSKQCAAVRKTYHKPKAKPVQ